MKKLLNSLAAMLLITASSSYLVSCQGDDQPASHWDDVNVKDTNYIAGVKNKIRSTNENNAVHAFMADAFHNYGVYKVDSNKDSQDKWSFYGDINGVLNYANDSISLDAFKGETVYAQLVLVGKQDTSNVTVDLPNLPDDVTTEVYKTGFTYNAWFDESADSRPWKTTFKDEKQRIADSLEATNTFTLTKDFVQPVFIKLQVGENAKVGNTEISVRTKVTGSNDADFSETINLNVLNQTLDMSEKDNFQLGAAPFVWSDIFKYAKRDENGHVDVNNLMGFLSDDHKKYLEPKLKSLVEHGQKFFWSWASNESSFKDRYVNAVPYDDLDETDPTKLDNAFLDGAHTGLIKWNYNGGTFNDASSWDFDFSDFDKLADYIKSLGFTDFYNANLVFNIEVDNDGNFKDTYRKIQYYNENGVLVYKNMNLNPNEADKTNNYGELLKIFLAKLNEHLTSSTSRIKNYIVYDEVNKQTVNYINTLIDETPNIHRHAFAGYKWTIDTDNQDEWDELTGDANDNHSIEAIVFGGYKIQEMFPDLDDNAKAEKFRALADERRKNGLSTMIYASRSTYPSTLVQSDYGDNLWTGIYATKLGMDGYFKWAYDKWVDNRLGEPNVGTDTGPQHAPNSDPYNDGGYLNQSPTGDEFLVYPNVDGGSNFVSSVRWELMNYSQEQALKLQTIEKDNNDAFLDIVNNVEWPTDPKTDENAFATFDNYFMWNTDYESAIDTNPDLVSAGHDAILAVYKINKYFGDK